MFAVLHPRVMMFAWSIVAAMVVRNVLARLLMDALENVMVEGKTDCGRTPTVTLEAFNTAKP